jgi:phytoene dehydrogenase-like protein
MVDAVVIGAGPNGLVAGNVLAQAGWDVLVLEAADEPGGAVRSGELVEPGFTNDLFSAFYPLAAASPAIRSLELEDHGLRWLRSRAVVAHPAADGTSPLLSMDLDETAASLDSFAAGDGDAWRRLYGRWRRVGDHVLGLLFGRQPPLRPALRLARDLRLGGLLEIARFASLPVRRLAEEEFRGAGGRRLLAGNALHADLAPETPPSAFFGWLLCSLGQSVGFPVPQGGAGALTAALVRRLRAHGGGVECGARVVRVLVRAGRATGVRLGDRRELAVRRAVIADTGAPQLYAELVGDEHLPPRLLTRLSRFQYDTSTVKVDWTLDGPIPWTAEPARRAPVVHVAEGVDELTAGASELARRLVPARPFLVMGQYSMIDPTRQPEGAETAWAYTHVPQSVAGDAGGEGLTGVWDEHERELFCSRVEERIEALAPGFRALIRGRHVFTPARFEAANPNLVGGALMGGTTQFHQQLVFRPLPGLRRYATPVPGLFLASASAHPGGGVHGACGANAARAALRQSARAFSATRR